MSVEGSSVTCLTGWLKIRGHTSEKDNDDRSELLHGKRKFSRSCCIFFRCAFFPHLSSFKNSNTYL